MGTTNIECERLLTDADFKKIRKLKKRAIEEKQLASEARESGPSIHMPNFNFMEEREKLKKLTHEMNTRMDRDSDAGAEEADDEGDLEGEEEDLEEGGEEAMDEEIIEEEDMEFEEGDEEGDEEEGEEGDEEGDEEELEEDSENEVVVKGKKIEKRPIDKKKRKESVEEEKEEESSSEESESEEPFADPRTSFLSTVNIFDPDRVKKRATLQAIKQGKKIIEKSISRRN